MAKNIMMLLTTFLIASCVNPVIKPKMLCDISFKFDRCRCGLYDLETLEGVGETSDYPLDHCEGIAGFYLEDISEKIIPKVKAKVRYCKDLMDESN